jgi:hypothetical protein
MIMMMMMMMMMMTMCGDDNYDADHDNDDDDDDVIADVGIKRSVKSSEPTQRIQMNQILARTDEKNECSYL